MTDDASFGVLEFAVDHLPDLVAIFDTNQICVLCNAPFREACPERSCVGKEIGDLCEDVERGDYLRTMLRSSLGGVQDEYTFKDAVFGAAPHRSIRTLPYPDAENADYAVLIATDTNAQSGINDKLYNYEYQDPTTGLLNRRSLQVVLERELIRSMRGKDDGHAVAVLFVMLKDFKHINQVHGHQIGDLLLENTGLRIRDTVRKSDYVFRWEGTNLIVLLPDITQVTDAALVAEKIHNVVSVPYRFNNVDVAPRCYIGISVYPDDSSRAEDLVNRANSAVIESEKQELPFLMYDETLHQSSIERLVMRTSLMRAFEQDELKLYYQPICTIDGHVAGAEALIRWEHPQRGLLGPDKFIELAEDTRLIGPIDKVALYQSCRFLAHLLERYPDFFLSLNMSATDLSDNHLVSVVQRAMQATSLVQTHRLKLEITESRSMQAARISLDAMQELTDLGVDVWIDDFGTGMSSLSYLKYLPATTVKIDREFAMDVGENEKEAAYLAGIIDMVRARGMDCIVEGVSTFDQFEHISSMSADYLQGYYFAKPMAPEKLEELLAGSRKLPDDR